MDRGHPTPPSTVQAEALWPGPLGQSLALRSHAHDLSLAKITGVRGRALLGMIFRFVTDLGLEPK